MSETNQDVELVQRTASGDSNAFREIYDLHSGAVLALAKRVLRNQELAEEVAQEVFVRLWNNPDKFNAERGSLRTFLMTMAHGRSVDVVRSETSRRDREERDAVKAPTSVVGVDESVERRLEDESIRSALDDLPEDQRVPIEMAYFGGHTYREVAAQLGQPEGTVKSRIRIGMTTLSKSLKHAT